MRRQVSKKKKKNRKQKLTLIAAAVLAIITALFTTRAHAQDSPAAKKTGRQIIVSIPHRQLAVIQNGQVLKVYSVAVGADESPSPDGDFTVTHRLVNPTYYHPGKVIGPGKANPLGTRWIGLNKKSYGIHGTNVPESIGKAASHGCIRMKQADLEELFAMLNTGDKVTIRREVDVEVAQIFGADVQASETSDSGSDTTN